MKGTLLAGVLVLTLAVGPRSGVSAQGAPDAPAPSITVIGYGESSAPAETAELQLLASRQDFGAPRAPDPEATPGAEEREAVGPMVEGLQAAGVAEEDIEIVVGTIIGGFYGPGGPGIARVDVTVDAPTRERIAELVDAAIVGAAEENLVISLVGVGYGVADCAPLDRGAREVALNDARARAELQAELMGVQLGEAVAASDLPIASGAFFNPYFGGFAPTDLSCSPPLSVPTGAPITLPPFDPTAEAEVEVYAQVAVTFAIAGEAAAAPAS